MEAQRWGSSSKLVEVLFRSNSSSSNNGAPEAPQICRSTLLISDSSLEKQFWRSVRALKFLDCVGLFNSVMLNVMLIRKFGWGSGKPDMLWHFLPVLLYLTAGLVQLALLALKPDLHQRHRFAINLTNRLVKAATVTWAAINMSQADVMHQFAGTLNSVPHTAAGGLGDAATYVKIVRTVASLPLLWVSHAVNFMLPFWLLLPLQLYTLAAVSSVVPSIVCVLLSQPQHILQPASVVATHVHSVVRTLVALSMPMPLPWMPAHSSADPVAQDLLVLVAITFVLILLVIPCVVAYYVELAWKTDFLRTRRALQPELESSDSSADEPPRQRPGMSPLWVVIDVVCVSLLVCEAIVRLASPTLLETCSACSAPVPN